MKSLRAVRGRAVRFRAQFVASVSDPSFSGMVGRAQPPLRRGAPSKRIIPYRVLVCQLMCVWRRAASDV